MSSLVMIYIITGVISIIIALFLVQLARLSSQAKAKTGGMKNYFVEMNLDLAKASVPYLKQLNV